MASIRSNIAKGRAFQTRVLELLKEAFGLTSDDIRVPIGAEPGPDIIYMSDLGRSVGLSIEIKNQQSISIWAALKQAKSHPGIPAVIFHRSKQGVSDVWITVPLGHYLAVRMENERENSNKE